MLGLIVFALEVKIVLDLELATLIYGCKCDQHIEFPPSFLRDLERRTFERCVIHLSQLFGSSNGSGLNITKQNRTRTLYLSFIESFVQCVDCFLEYAG